MSHRPTYFIDIDGTLLKHHQDGTHAVLNQEAKVLPHVNQFLEFLEQQDACIILTTARRESLRKITEDQLLHCGIFYDQLIMGCGHGPRYLVNDIKSDGSKSAFAINLERNIGPELDKFPK